MKHALFAVLTPSWCCRFRTNDTKSDMSVCETVSAKQTLSMLFFWVLLVTTEMRTQCLVHAFWLVSCTCVNLQLVMVSISHWNFSKKDIFLVFYFVVGFFVCVYVCELSQKSLFMVLYKHMKRHEYPDSFMNQYQWFSPLESHYFWPSYGSSCLIPWKWIHKSSLESKSIALQLGA